MSVERYLRTLIRFPTVTGEVEEAERCFQYVKDTIQPVPAYVREYRHKGLPALVVTPTRRKRAKLWLAAHIDVVAGPEELFEPRLTGRRIYGRGAIDMKFAIACYLELLTELGVDYRAYDVGMMLTADEEWGSDSAVRYLLEEEGYGGEVVFLPDGYGTWKFEEAAKGIWGVEVCTDGKASHGSKPWHGRSAIRELAAFLTEAYTRMERFIQTDADHWYATMNVGAIEGGCAHNMVAPEARATIDVRYTTKRELNAIQTLFRTLQRMFSHTHYRVTHNEPPYGIHRTNGFATTFAALARERQGITCGWVRSHGSSDARFFNRHGIPVLLIGPNGGESHGDREWIDRTDLIRYYDVLRAFVTRIASHP